MQFYHAKFFCFSIGNFLFLSCLVFVFYKYLIFRNSATVFFFFYHKFNFFPLFIFEQTICSYSNLNATRKTQQGAHSHALKIRSIQMIFYFLYSKRDTKHSHRTIKLINKLKGSSRCYQIITETGGVATGGVGWLSKSLFNYKFTVN